jgi:hypothetical protein
LVKARINITDYYEAKIATKTKKATDEKFANFAIWREGWEPPLKWAQMAAKAAMSDERFLPISPN